jgi:hypothetical protein
MPKNKKNLEIEVDLDSCIRGALELAQQAYKFAPSSYTHAVLAALHNAARFLPVKETTE